MKAHRISLNLVLAASLFNMIQIPVTSQTPKKDPLPQTVRVKLEGVNTPDTVAEALYNTGVPGGIAFVHHCRGGFPTRSLKPSSASLSALLDAVVSADPDYSWSTNEGVVNLTPSHIKLQFLDTKVSNLDLKSKTPDEALNILLDLPEVQSEAKNELGIRLFQGFLEPFPRNAVVGPQGKTVSMLLTNTTVAGALNAIARAHESAVWVLIKNDCNSGGRKIFTIKFITNDHSSSISGEIAGRKLADVSYH